MLALYITTKKRIVLKHFTAFRPRKRFEIGTIPLTGIFGANFTLYLHNFV